MQISDIVKIFTNVNVFLFELPLFCAVNTGKVFYNKYKVNYGKRKMINR